MVEKQAFNVGDRIEQLCLTCGEERGHIVIALGKKGQITRISCPMCGSTCAYKAAVETRRSKELVSGMPYSQTRIYRKGENLTHHIFGAGQVTALVQPAKMDVLFSDRLRRLICGNQ